MNKQDERARTRMQALRQYRMLCKLEKQARKQRLYSVAVRYRIEAANMKEGYNL